ncbi:hypothetical protein EJ110_NYTH59723 [Nymphaea thermarum]|nr:hypothetical protein EJ110_NYTH59723 [Nymphaea thermarum]
MNADIYNALLKAMVMPDKDDINCYPVHTSAAAAIGELLEVFEPAFAALAATSRTWVDSLPEEEDPNETARDWKTGTATVNREIDVSLPPSSCLDAVSSILGTLMKLIIDKSQLFHLRIEELLVIWSQLIAEWDAWEEMEDMAVFAAIEEVVVIVKKYELKSFFVRTPLSPPSPPVPPCSIIEGIGAFLAKAISAYPSAT